MGFLVPSHVCVIQVFLVITIDYLSDLISYLNIYIAIFPLLQILIRVSRNLGLAVDKLICECQRSSSWASVMMSPEMQSLAQFLFPARLHLDAQQLSMLRVSLADLLRRALDLRQQVNVLKQQGSRPYENVSTQARITLLENEVRWVVRHIQIVILCVTGANWGLYKC